LEFKVPSVFISYSSNDQIKVERLAEALRQEQDITVWLDTTNIYPGDDFLEEMSKGFGRLTELSFVSAPRLTKSRLFPGSRKSSKWPC
jgi:hypothetical protein